MSAQNDLQDAIRLNEEMDEEITFIRAELAALRSERDALREELREVFDSIRIAQEANDLSMIGEEMLQEIAAALDGEKQEKPK